MTQLPPIARPTKTRINVKDDRSHSWRSQTARRVRATLQPTQIAERCHVAGRAYGCHVCCRADVEWSYRVEEVNQDDAVAVDEHDAYPDCCPCPFTWRRRSSMRSPSRSHSTWAL